MLVLLLTQANVPSLPYPLVSRVLYILARVGTSCWYLFCTVLRLVSQTRANVPCLPYPLRSSLGYHGCCTYSPVLVPRAGTSFVQCFAWSAKRGQMCLVCPTPCAVRLGITGAVHTRPCWYLVLVPLCTVLRLASQTRANVPSLPYPLRSSLGYHGR